MLVLFALIGLNFTLSITYFVFLILLGFVLIKKKSPGWILALSVSFILLFYAGISGSRSIEGAGVAEVTRMLFLLGSLSGLALIVMRISMKKELALFTAPVMLVAISPIFSALIVQAYATFFDIHGNVSFI